jgi:DNA-binding transcriptional regulator GbsR (MarR family)
MLPSVTRDDELELCEAFGRLLEGNGSSRISGRLVGWLLLCDPPEQTPAQLVEVLGISKASVSTELRRLEQLGVIERTTLPGDRRSYWRVAAQAWPELMERRLRMIDHFVALADQGLALLEHEPAARRTRLQGMRHAYAQLQRTMRSALTDLRREAEPVASPRARKPTSRPATKTKLRGPRKARER